MTAHSSDTPSPSDQQDVDTRTHGSRVTLLTREHCHLCGPVRAVVQAVCARTGELFTEINVDADPDLQGEYGQQVPVVLVDGEFVSSYRITDAELLAALGATL